MDIILLWRRNRANVETGVLAEQYEVVGELGNEILGTIRSIDGSINYLKRVQKGGLYQGLLFLLDNFYCTMISNAWRGMMIHQFVFPWPSRWPLNVEDEVRKLERQRTELVRYLGSILNEQQLHTRIAPEFDARRLPRPSWISRFLVPGVGVAMVLLTSYRFIKLINWSEVYSFTQDLLLASKHLLQDWIINPLVEIWKTIRYRSSNLALVSAAALKADMDSLERMVVNFAQRHYPTIPESEVSSQVRNGDVTLMLKRYEAELHAPLRNVILGDIVSMLLIQVQKSKVDLEGAMMAMDKLLKANELNFELLAIVPLFIVLYYLYGTGRYYFKRFWRKPERQLLAQIRKKTHELERILNMQEDGEFITGESVVIMQGMLNIWNGLPQRWHNQYDEEFYRDLSELLSRRSNDSKLWTITRMYHFYPFLHAATCQ